MLSSVEVDLGNGRIITLETGKMAKQANGAVLVRSGDSVVLVTACTAPEPKPGIYFTGAVFLCNQTRGTTTIDRNPYAYS